MHFESIRIIASDVARLVSFYEQVTQTPAQWRTPEFAELPVHGGTIAIGSPRTLQAFGIALKAGGNQNTLVEFRVDDVDAHFTRLEGALTEVVQKPTTMPWGNRSLLFRDPEGALVNLFTPVTPEQKRRYEK